MAHRVSHGGRVSMSATILLDRKFGLIWSCFVLVPLLRLCWFSLESLENMADGHCQYCLGPGKEPPIPFLLRPPPPQR